MERRVVGAARCGPDGGLGYELPDGLYAHLAGYFLVTTAVIAMLVELLNPYGAGGATKAEIPPNYRCLSPPPAVNSPPHHFARDKTLGAGALETAC